MDNTIPLEQVPSNNVKAICQLAYIENGKNYIQRFESEPFESKDKGLPLTEIWSKFSAEQRAYMDYKLVGDKTPTIGFAVTGDYLVAQKDGTYKLNVLIK